MDRKVKAEISCSTQSIRTKEARSGKVVTLPFLILLFLQISCQQNDKQKNVIARVLDEELTAEEVGGIVPRNISKLDSSDFANRYIKSWVKKQLFFESAKSNLSYDKAEVERKLLDYKYALIVFEYQKKYLNEKLDTLIEEEEIEKYYAKNLDNFELKQNIVKAMYVKAPLKAPKLDRLKKWMQADNKNYKALKSYCYRFANHYVLEDTIWNNFDELIVNSPFSNIPDKVQFLKRTKFAEIIEGDFMYFLNIRDYKITDQNSPLEFVRPQIVNIILNKRKVELIQELEKEIYNKAIKSKSFEIYSENN